VAQLFSEKHLPSTRVSCRAFPGAFSSSSRRSLRTTAIATVRSAWIRKAPGMNRRSLCGRRISGGRCRFPTPRWVIGDPLD